MPISDYVPASETKNWIATGENMSGGKLWAMPQYLLGIPFVWNKALFKKAGLDPNKGPKTWTEFLADAKKLKAAGITPFGMGNKDGYGGAWFFSLIGKQNLNSINELKDAMIGKAKFARSEVLGLLPGARRPQEERLPQLRRRLDHLHPGPAALRPEEGRDVLGHGRQRRGRGEGARGAKDMGVGPIPIWGKGKLATSYDTTQSSRRFITKWSKHPRAAAQFLVFLHKPQALKAWYKATGVFPADKRFPASLVTDPIAKEQLKLDHSPVIVWPENYVPPQVDGGADLAAGELITSGSGTPADAVKLWEQELSKWKTQHPDEFQAYSKWVNGG